MLDQPTSCTQRESRDGIKSVALPCAIKPHVTYLNLTDALFERMLSLIAKKCCEYRTWGHSGFQLGEAEYAGEARLTLSWDAIRCQEQFGCTVSIGLHRGTLY